MTLYLSGAVAYCIFLIYKMFSERECSKTEGISWIVITIASLLWVIVIPISIIEIQSKTKVKAQSSIQTKQINSGLEIH
ncbi:hypothetical protein [Pleurocapsa sp. FMAR1]|uniref:hypothetical protein n=1 Tax=Pleurocapsa sp. FMAR1 TaxID=3040204 RepID=UPI0029C8F98E|nr:hypothetical protein [Pleurocapsa sp. FMAR1]